MRGVILESQAQDLNDRVRWGSENLVCFQVRLPFIARLAWGELEC